MSDQDTLTQNATPTALTQLSRGQMLRQGMLTKPDNIQTFKVKYDEFSESWDTNAFDTNKIDYYGYDKSRKAKATTFKLDIGKAIDKYIKFNKKISPIKITKENDVYEADDLYAEALLKVTITKDGNTKVFEGTDLKTQLSKSVYTLKDISDFTESKRTYKRSAAGEGEATIEVELDMRKLNNIISKYDNAAGGGRRRSTRKYKKSNKRVKSAKRISQSRKYRSRK
jgi:hypothetical protein